MMCARERYMVPRPLLVEHCPHAPQLDQDPSTKKYFFDWNIILQNKLQIDHCHYSFLWCVYCFLIFGVHVFKATLAAPHVSQLDHDPSTTH